MTKNEKKAITALKKQLEASFSILDLKLYGSKTQNTDTPESDIDLMIVLDQITPKIEAQIDKIVFDINLKYDCLISTLIFSTEEIQNGPLSESPIYKNIIKFGVSV